MAGLAILSGALTTLIPPAATVVLFSYLPSVLISGLLHLLGMSATGPVAGGLMAWCQSTFFGGFIPAGSWFALVQQFAMTSSGLYPSAIGGVIGAVAAFLG